MFSTNVGTTSPSSVLLAPVFEQATSVQAQIELEIGKIAYLYQDLNALLLELDGLSPPTHPGGNASVQDLAAFGEALVAFNKRLALLNSKLSDLQEKLALMQAKLSSLQMSDLPQAQREDSNNMRAWAEKVQKALENKLTLLLIRPNPNL